MRSRFQALWTASAPLTVTGIVMVVALAASLVGLWLDPRVITGAPAWLKPAKFAASIAIYSFTLAWVFTYLPAWPRVRRVVGWTTAIAMFLELGIIDAQAWRGTTSHFNTATLVDGVLFTIMGATTSFKHSRALPWRWRCGGNSLRIARSAGRCVSA